MTRDKSEHARLCSTAKSRVALCGELRALAHRCGATVAQTANDLSPRAIYNTFAKGNYRCGVRLEGGSRVGAFLGHWYIEGRGPEKYSYEFASAIRGSVNIYHWHKATSCEDTWPGFLQSLEAGLNALEATP